VGEMISPTPPRYSRGGACQGCRRHLVGGGKPRVRHKHRRKNPRIPSRQPSTCIPMKAILNQALQSITNTLCGHTATLEARLPS
jgi:hypothetical protein